MLDTSIVSGVRDRLPFAREKGGNGGENCTRDRRVR